MAIFDDWVYCWRGICKCNMYNFSFGGVVMNNCEQCKTAQELARVKTELKAAKAIIREIISVAAAGEIFLQMEKLDQNNA